MEEIKVVIPKSGPVTIDVNGFKGPGYKDLTKAIEKALGQVTQDTKKQEFYDEQEQKLTQKA